MKTFNFKTGFIALCLCAVANFAFALDGNETVGDVSGQQVRDSQGFCVRTKWETNDDECARKVDISKMSESIIYFDFDKSELSASEKIKIVTLANIFTQHNIERVKIVGYTDMIGASSYNDALSQRRANEVKSHLTSLVKLESAATEVRAMGSANPVKDCGTLTNAALKECLAPNRRVEVELDYTDTIQVPE